MKRLLLFVFTAAMMWGCNRTSEADTSAAPANVDSLTAAFIAGWNNKDSAAIMATIAENCIVMNDSLIHQGRSAIAGKWVSGGVRVLSDIRTSSVIKDAGLTIAYDAGTYSLNLTIPGGPVLREKGNYNLIWTKQQDSTWKLTLVHIEDITRMPDVR